MIDQQSEVSDEVTRSGCVLLVDDQTELLSSFELAFGDEFEIWTAPNALEGFQVFEDHQAEIDLVLADQRMPGERGIDFLQRVKSHSPNKPCFLVTAYSEFDVLATAINEGCVDQFVRKPWDPRVLESQIRTFIEESRSQGGFEKNDALLAASMMAMQAGSAGMLQLGVSELYGSYLRSIEVFTGSVGSYYYGGGPSVSTADVHRMLNMLCDCSQHATDIFGCDERAADISIGESLHTVLANLSGEMMAKNVHCELSICDPEPRLFVDNKIWLELLSELISRELACAVPGATMSITVSLQSRDNCVYALALKISHLLGRGAPREDAGSGFEELARQFAQQLLAKILGMRIQSSLVDDDGGKRRILTATLPADSISTGQHM